MSSVNKVLLLGRLGNTPELKNTSGGTPVCNFSVATNESWKDDKGVRQERTEWHRIVVFSKQAETCARYLSKGKEVFIEGTLQTRSWEDKEKVKRYTTEVLARSVQFLGSASDNKSSHADQANNQAINPATDAPYTSADIPF